MIIRGIVTEDELQPFQPAAAHHQLTDQSYGTFRTWKEDEIIWLEVDVNESVMEYLKGSGFFDGI